MASLALSCCALPASPAAVPCGQEAAAWAAAAVPWLGTAALGKAAGGSRGCPGLCCWACGFLNVLALAKLHWCVPCQTQARSLPSRMYSS